jgi:chemotaxis protein MotB
VRRRRRQKGHANHERWLVSYADFITLLFAVFVVMYASSKVDNRKIGELSQAIHDGFKNLGVFQSASKSPPFQIVDGKSVAVKQIIEPPSPASANPALEEGQDTSELRRVLGQALSEEIDRREAQLWDGPDGLVLSFSEIGFYDQGSDVLKETSRGALDKLAGVLKPTKFRVRIEGHTDNIPIHNERFASNWELSTARATGMVRIFLERYGFPPARLAAAGYAEFHPVAPNATAEERGQNRRVDIVMLAASKTPLKSVNAATSDTKALRNAIIPAPPAVTPTPQP